MGEAAEILEQEFIGQEMEELEDITNVTFYATGLQDEDWKLGTD